VALLLQLDRKTSRMQQENTNRFYFLGEVIEVFQQNGQRWMKTICKPGRIMIQIPEDSDLNMGDSVKVTCSLMVEKLEKQLDSY
jgi:hypothetical protein